MIDNSEYTNNFLKEGTEYFKTQKFPETFPAYIAQISDSIREFNRSVERSSASSEKLAKSIKSLTYVSVIIAGSVFVWDIIKFVNK
jgi:hypothetical protein